MATRDETVEDETAHYEYSYDALGRLVSVDKDGEVVERYTYDDNGNRSAATTTSAGKVNAKYDAQDRLLSNGKTKYKYTNAGDLSRKTEGDAVTAYTYDRRGNLRKVELPNGSEIEYVIDGHDRRVGKRIAGKLVTGFIYKDALNPIVQVGPDGETIQATFIYATNPYLPDLMIKDGIEYRLISDAVGSVRLVVDSASGEVAQRLDYDAFGVVLNDTNPGFQPFGFAGGVYDPDTGLVRFGARDYDARVGRWTAKDPIRWEGGQGNLFVYVGNDPVNFADPSGLRLVPVDAPSQEVLLVLWADPVLRPMLEEMNSLEQEIGIEHMLPTAVGSPSGAIWKEELLKLEWNAELVGNTFHRRGWGGGVAAAVAHELGHAYASEVLGVNTLTPEGEAISNAWSVAFQNQIANSRSGTGAGCRDKH